MKMDSRKQQILIAIIHDYIATAEPVGSRTIARKYKLGISPATIRNEMADLEEMGYIEQPHTSAGRVPSERGYRYYVDYLMQREELTREEQGLVRQSYEAKVKGVGEIIQYTGKLMAQLTNCTAVVLSTQRGSNAFRHIQLVQMTPEKALLIVVMDNGTVHHRLIEMSDSITQSDLDTISAVLNAKLQGRTMERIKMTLLNEIYFELAKHEHILNMAMELVDHSLSMDVEDKIYLGGVFNILNQPEFHNVDKVKTMLGILEQEKMLGSIMADGFRSDGVTVRIGGEISNDQMRDCSMVMATYSVKGKPQGSVGVLGPTRMDYARMVTVVDYMTKNLSLALERFLRGCGK